METKVFQETVLFCLPRSIELTSKAQLSNEPNVARAYFSNFAFFRFDCERGFFANINSKKICFQMLKTHKQLIELIRIGRISNGILSFASIPINHDEDINSVEAEIDSVSWFSSLLSLNLTTAPIIEYYSNDKIVRYFIRDTARSSLNSSYYIVDNLRIKGGIPKAFDSCYQNYKILQTRMGINKVIDFLVEINQQKHIDIKLATTFMTYEYLLLKYLLDQGWTQDRIGDNIQKKLNQANKSLCIIPKTLKSDELRGSVRNPLFHQGEIPLLTLEEKIDLFEEYYDLLIQITLKIFDYNAQYMSIVTQKPSQITNIA